MASKQNLKNADKYNISDYKKKDNKINYDIDSITESAYNGTSRMLAKNIKYKNKKTSSNLNNIKTNMKISGIRNLYIPSKKFIKEGAMSRSSNRRDDDSEYDDKSSLFNTIESREEYDNSDGSPDEDTDEDIDEDTYEDPEETVEPRRSKGSKKSSKKSSRKSHKKSSKKSRSKKYDRSESSLVSLSSSSNRSKTQNTTATQTMKNTMTPNSASYQNSILSQLPDGYNGPVPQSIVNSAQSQQGPSVNTVNSFAKVFGHDGAAGMPQNLPMTNVSGMGGNPMGEMSMMSPQMPMMSPQMPMMSPQMPMMSPQMPMGANMPQMPMGMNMPQMPMGMNMPQMPMGINMPENGMSAQAPVQAPTSAPIGNQAGGRKSHHNNPVTLRLKKDFFF